MRLILFFIVFLNSVLPASASDGVLEINQACATQGGCFAGDAAGFPVTISQPGSYRLTGNLTLPLNTTAIDITASAVVVDLGGFAITGPNVCSGAPITGCTAGAVDIPGIRANQNGQTGVTVRDGSIIGMSGSAVHSLNNGLPGSSGTVVEDLFVKSNNGNAGITVGALSRVSRCRIIGNRLHGIYADVFSLVDENIMYLNGQTGIVFGTDSGGGGGGEALRNQMRFNGGPGISVPVGTITRENIMSANGGGSGSLGSSQGNNLCDNVSC